MPDRPLTLKQEIFCRKYLECDLNASEALRQTYAVSHWKPESIWQVSSRLMANVKVSSRIQQLIDEAIRASAVTPQKIVSEFSRYAFQKEPGAYKKIAAKDRLTAAANLAKCLGMFIDRTELTGKGGAPLEVEIVARLAAARSRLAALPAPDAA